MLPLVDGSQVLPSVEYTIIFGPPPIPTATHLDNELLHAIPLQPSKPLNIALALVDAVQVTPSGEVAIVFNPEPTATHNPLLYARPAPPC